MERPYLRLNREHTVPEVVVRRRTGKRRQSLQRRIRTWWTKNRSKAAGAIAFALAATFGLGAAVVLISGLGNPPSVDEAPAPQ